MNTRSSQLGRKKKKNSKDNFKWETVPNRTFKYDKFCKENMAFTYTLSSRLFFRNEASIIIWRIDDRNQTNFLKSMTSWLYNFYEDRYIPWEWRASFEIPWDMARNCSKITLFFSQMGKKYSQIKGMGETKRYNCKQSNKCSSLRVRLSLGIIIAEKFF